MPTIAHQEKVLDGKAEVISYERDPSVFYLRVYVPEKRSYKTRRFTDCASLVEAKAECLDLFLELNQNGATRSKPRRGITDENYSKKYSIDKAVKEYLAEQKKLVDSNLLQERTYQQKEQFFNSNFTDYCRRHGISDTKQIKVGFLDDYLVEHGEATRMTLKTHISRIKQFLNYLSKHRLMGLYEAANIKLILPKIKIRDVDNDANPPFTPQAWRIFLNALHQWQGEKTVVHQSSYQKNYRRMMWTLFVFLKQSGLRPVEAFALNWEDITMENVQRVRSTGETVDRFVSHVKVWNSKTGSIREVSCNAYDRLYDWSIYQKNRAASLGIKITKETKVFSIARNGEMYQPTYLSTYKAFNKVLDKARPYLPLPELSRKYYTLYSCRSSRAFDLMSMGVDIYIAAQQMGHSVVVLQKIYSRLPQRRRATEEAARLPIGEPRRKESLTFNLLDGEDS